VILFGDRVRLEILRGELRRRAREPRIDDHLAERLFVDRIQLNEHPGVAVEVGDCEQAVALRGEQRLLVVEIDDGPGAVAVSLALGYLGQPGRDPGCSISRQR